MRISLYLLAFSIGTFLISGCHPTPPTPDPMESVTYPTPAGSLPELIENLSSDDLLVRIVSMRALEAYGPEAAPAVPVLISNLYKKPSSVRWGAAIAPGNIGPEAREAVPDLITVLQTDDTYQVRVYTADALGKIGDPSAIPALVETMYDYYDDSLSNSLTVACAEAIALITGEKFTDMGGPGYTLTDEWVPLIVIDAREWWETEGQYQDWEGP